jgi:hypothetical protein
MDMINPPGMGWKALAELVFVVDVLVTVEGLFGVGSTVVAEALSVVEVLCTAELLFADEALFLWRMKVTGGELAADRAMSSGDTLPILLCNA